MPETRGSIGILERILHLKAIPAVRQLPYEALAALAGSSRERYYPKGSLLFSEDSPIPSINVILDGRVRVSRGDFELTNAGPGTPLGALGVIARIPLGLRGVAEADTLALELDSETFLEACDDHFVIVHGLLRYMARWVVEIETRAGPAAPPPGACRPPTRMLGGDLDIVERIFYLRQFSAFAEASINALAELSRGLTEVRFDAGVPLWTAGDPSPYALLVVDGEVACQAPEHGPRFRTCAGWGIGHMEALAEQRRWFSATTATPVVALHGSIEGLIDVFEDNTEMAMGFLSLLARGILSYMDRRGREAVPSPIG